MLSLGVVQICCSRSDLAVTLTGAVSFDVLFTFILLFSTKYLTQLMRSWNNRFCAPISIVGVYKIDLQSIMSFPELFSFFQSFSGVYVCMIVYIYFCPSAFVLCRMFCFSVLPICIFKSRRLNIFELLPR